METTIKINLRRILRLNPQLGAQLTRNSKTLDEAINELAEKSNLIPEFINMNIDRIRNWI